MSVRKKHDADCLIRINGDSPLISAHVIKKAILFRKKFTKTRYRHQCISKNISKRYVS